MIVLGIDPGTLNLGWGCIQTDERGRVLNVEFGSFHLPSKMPLYDRLGEMSLALSELIQDKKPEVAVIESLFLGKSVDSAFKLGHIRGVCAAQCRLAGADIVEYQPRTVKKQVTGSGGADKEVVRQFLFQQLNVKGQGKSLDATDALALAYCHVLKEGTRARHKDLRFQ